MRIVFFGSGQFAVPSLRWLINSPHEVALVVTQPDRPAGRGKQLLPTPVAERAIEDGVPLERCQDVNQPEFIERARQLRPDIGIVIAFGQKILAPLREAFPSQCVNLHASLLPKFRGAGPIQASILAGENKTGVSVFRLVDRMDAGPVLVRRETMIGPYETAGELHDRLCRVGCDAIDATLQLHATEPLPPGEPQDETQASKAPKLKKSDGFLRFDEPAEQIALRCRAMWPWPGARCRYVSAEGRAEEIAISAVTAIPQSAALAPGTVTDVLTVATGAGTLELHTVQPAGKRAMGWQEFVNGRHVRAGDRMESIGAK
jgi:methionyl-tRNA formyltransferase